MSQTASAPIIARGRRAEAEGEERAPSSRGRALAVAAAVLLALAVLVSLLTSRSASEVPLAPDNPDPEGARAAAQVLREQGVTVTHVQTTQAALNEAEAGTTLLVVRPTDLRPEQQQALAEVAADVVLVDLDSGDLEALTDRVSVTGFAERTTRVADCANPDAQAAESIVAGGAVVTGTDIESCFVTDGGAGYATWTVGEQRWHVIADGWALSNDGLAEAGNAALVFRTLGVHDRLVWYVPSDDDPFGTESLTEQFPVPGPAVLQLLLIGVALVLWKGRRLGPVVVEPLPVVVKATETTRGRGRLYRRARAHAHAAAALRAGLIARVAGRVGLPSHATPHQVVETLARASGRSHEAIHDVLYGPPPNDDAGLVALTQALDTLESEVQRG